MTLLLGSNQLECKVDGTPSQIPTLCANVINSVTVEWTDGLALAHTYHERKSCSKLSEVLPSGLRGDSVMDRWMDRLTDGRTEK